MNVFRGVTSLVLCFAASQAAWADSSAVRLDSFHSHSRLSIRADEGVEPQWKDIDGGFELTLKGLWFADLGAPLGAEQEWVDQIAPKLRDQRLASLKFNETTAGLVVRGRWKFPEGKDRPADARMERFDFREKSPAQYVVDFWPKKGPTVGEVEATRLREQRESERKAIADSRQRKAERKIASQRARAEAEDLGRFCRGPLSPENTVFLPLNPLHERPELSKYVAMPRPDADFEYPMPDGKGEDARYVRLAVSLYQQGKYALAIRTIDFFDSEQPKSIHADEMRFLRANAMIKLGHVKDGEELLKDLGRSKVSSEYSVRSALFLALRAYDRKYHLGALEEFMALAERNPKHPLTWLFHLASAESLYSLRQVERAAKEYQWVALNAPTAAYRAQGALRLGDLYLDRQQYESALAAYFQALRHYANEAKSFAAVHLNRGESLYWLEDFTRAQDAFEAFLKEFPSHPAGWRATLRLAEIRARKASDADQLGAKERFLETINRYPMSPGATMARLRLIPCGDHGGFDLAALEAFFDREITAFKAGQVDFVMERFEDLRSVARVQGYLGLTQASRATDIALQELKKAKGAQSKDRISSIAGELFRKSILEMLASGKQFEALKYYEERANKISTPQTDPDFLLKLSQAASELGLGKLASDIVSSHDRARLEATRHGRMLAASDSDDLEARIRKGERSFTEARALWTDLSSVSKSGPTADKKAKIEALLKDVPEESELSYEREIILGLMAERTGKASTALAHALRAQLLIPSGSRKDSGRIDHWVARLQAQAGSKKAASDAFKRLQSLSQQERSTPGRAASLGVGVVPDNGDLFMAEAELLGAQGQWGQAAAAYSRAIEQGLGGNRALYEFARAIGKTEDPDEDEMKKARAALEKAASSSKDDFWKKLARESLQSKGTRGLEE